MRIDDVSDWQIGQLATRLCHGDPAPAQDEVNRYDRLLLFNSGGWMMNNGAKLQTVEDNKTACMLYVGCYSG